MRNSEFKTLPRWADKLPWFSKVNGFCLYPYIFLKFDISEDLRGGSPSHKSMAVLLHEQEHIRRMKEMGPIKFAAGYLVSGKFRFNEELLATQVAMKYMKKNNVDPAIEKRTKALSGWLYLWSVPYKYAKTELELAWKEA